MEPLPSLDQPTRLARFCGGIGGSAVLFLIPFLLYGVSLGYPLLFLDDGIYFVRNPLLAQGRIEGITTVWTGLHYGYTPITHLSIWVDVFLREQGIHGWWLARLHQLAWISVGVLGVRRVVWQITGCPVIAWSIAALFALHPVCASTALWMALRRQALCFAFSIWAISFYLSALKAASTRSYVMASLGVLLCGACAGLSRFNAVSLVLVAPLLGLLIQGRNWRRSIALLAALVAPILAMIAITVLWRDPVSLTTYRLGDSMAGTLWLDGEILARYLWNLVWPWQLAAYYGVTEVDGISWRQGAYWLGIAALVAVSIKVARNRREMVILWLVSGAMVGPTLNLVTQVIAMADHYLQPAVPFLLLIGWRLGERGWATVSTRMHANWPITVFILACLYFALAAWPRNLQFSSSVAFSVQSAKNSPQSALMLSYAINALRLDRNQDSTLLIEEMCFRALNARDLRRCNGESINQMLQTAISAMLRNREYDEAHRLLTRHGARLAPQPLFILRSQIITAEGDADRGLKLIKSICPITDDFIEKVWRSRVGGLHLPVIMVPGIEDRPIDIYHIPNPLASNADHDVWEQRTIFNVALMYADRGDHLAAAKYALALVSINPQMVYGWDLLAESYEGLGQSALATAARARWRILTTMAGDRELD
jgi:hypothetical protein